MSNQKPLGLLFTNPERLTDLVADRIEQNPWIHVWRIVNAEAERSGDRSLIDHYVRLFKAWEASHYRH